MKLCLMEIYLFFVFLEQMKINSLQGEPDRARLVFDGKFNRRR
jgi:hypothetical protein